MVRVERMPGDPTPRGIGDLDGLWRIVLEDVGTGSYEPRHPKRHVHAENLSFEEGQRQADKLEHQLNPKG